MVGGQPDHMGPGYSRSSPPGSWWQDSTGERLKRMGHLLPRGGQPGHQRLRPPPHHHVRPDLRAQPGLRFGHSDGRIGVQESRRRVSRRKKSQTGTQASRNGYLFKQWVLQQVAVTGYKERVVVDLVPLQADPPAQPCDRRLQAGGLP